MKQEIYIKGEMSKGCSECEWFTPNHCDKGGRYFCLLARMPFYNTEVEREKGRGQQKGGLNDFDCPLQPLAEHDKQIRKEVVQEIRETLCMTKENTCPSTANVVYYDVLSNILDQIEGEENGKIDSK